MSATDRARHPFHMHDAVRGQPDAVVRVAERLDPAMAAFAARVASCDRLFLVGTGTSHHAALVGEHLLGSIRADLPVRAYPAFDFALYGPTLGTRDCVIGISHRGNKTYTARSVARAREAGCRTALVTGEGGNPAERIVADDVFETVPQERSATHTISYSSSIAALSVLAAHLGDRTAGARQLSARRFTDDVPAAMRAGLALEGDMASWARAHVDRRRIWLTGGGPSAITALEVALKIKEAAYLQAEGLSIETFLHGPFLCAAPEDLFVLIAPAGAAQERVLELAGMVTAIGGTYVVISDVGGDGLPEQFRRDAAGWCTVPPVPEPLTTLTCLVPLQLFSYHLALCRGTNPDVFRLDDPRFARARALIQL